MKKATFIILTICVTLLLSENSFAARQVINGADQFYGATGNPSVDGARFRTDNTLTTNGDGDNFAAAAPSISVDAPGNIGTLTCVGSTTISGNVGSAVNGLKALNSNGGAGKIVALNGNSYISTLNFGGDSKVTIGAGNSFTGNVTTTTDNTGTLAFKGSSTFTGDVGASGAALKMINANGTGKTVSFSGNIFATELNYGGNNTVNIADGKTLTGKITTDTNSTGTLVLDGTSGVTGQIATTGKRLKELKTGATVGNVTLGDNVYSDLVTIANTGTVAFNGNLTGTTLNYTANGTVTIADGKTLKPDVTTSAGGQGILTFLGESTVNGKVGTAGTKINQVNIDGTGKTVAFKDNINALGLNFGGDSTMTLANNRNLNTKVTTSTFNTGTITFLGDSTVSGMIGVAGTEIKQINIDGVGGGYTVAFQNGVHTQGLNFGDDNTITIANNHNLDTTVTTFTNNTGTITFLGDSTDNGNLGTPGAILKQINANGAGNTVIFKGDVYATTVDIAGAGGILKVRDGLNMKAAVENSGGGGTLTFNGATKTGGTIGAVNPLTAVNFYGLTNLGHDISATTTTIRSGGTVTLSKNVTITGDLTNNVATSVLNIGTNTLTLAGSGIYTQNAGSTLRVGVSGTTSGSILAVGNAAVNAGSNLTVNVGGYVPSNTAFKILDANTGGGGVAAPTTITSSSPLYTFAATTDTDDLTLTAIQANTFSSIAAGVGAGGVGAALDSIAAGGANSDMLTVINALSSMGSTQEIADSIATMAPDVSSGTIQSSRALANLLLGSVSNRLGFARNGVTQVGVSAGDMFHGFGFWLQELGSHLKQDERKGTQGYQANTFGTAVGADKLITNHTRLGFAGGYGFADMNSKAAGSPTTDINSFQGMIYGSYDSLNLRKGGEIARGSKGGIRSPGEDSWYVDSAFSFTQNNYDSRREITLPNDNRVAKADHYGQQYSTRFESGYTFVFDCTKALEITPLASLGYSYLYMNRYKEKGAEALNLYVNGDGFQQLEQGLGGRLAYPVVFKKAGTFIPAAKAAWLYDYIADRFDATAEFAGGGPSFETKGVKPAKNGFIFGAEIAFLSKGNMTITGNWDWEIRDQYSGHTYYGTVRFDF